MKIKLNKKKLLAVNWNTKFEISLRLIIIINAILFLLMSYFNAHGWAQSLNFYKYILDFISYSQFIKTANIYAIIAMFITLIFTLTTVIAMVKVKEEPSLKGWILIIAVIWIIYFIIFFSISIKMGRTYWSNFLIAGFVINIFNIILIEIALFYLWLQIKIQKQIKLFFDYQSDKKEIIDSKK